jgi:ABC-2 type transport system ATP-binding protein
VRGKIKIVDTPSNLKSLVKGKVIELSFDRAVDKKLLVVEGVEFVEGDKARYRISTSDQELAIRSLFKFAESNNLRILSINTILPSLEDSFVKIAGVEKELMLLEKESKGGLKSAMG